MNVDAEEVAKFEALAHRWWDADGEFKPLHDINGPRVEYIGDRCALEGRTVLDVGCGGGLLTEALCGLGAEVTGIDPGAAPLAVARLHAAESGLAGRIDYVSATAESYLATADRSPTEFAVVTCLETLEHVPDVGATVRALAGLAQPGGDVFLATINRTPKAFALAILGAEYVLNILPKGTHDYEKLIRPSELAGYCRDADLAVLDIQGMAYNPFTRRVRFTDDVAVNYILHAKRAGVHPKRAGAHAKREGAQAKREGAEAKRAGAQPSPDDAVQA